MKSLPQSLKPGNLNMKGKKTMKMACGCCVAQNFKEEVLVKELEKEKKNMLH